MAIQIPRGAQLPLEPKAGCEILQRQTDSFGTFLSLDRILYHEARYSRIVNRNYKEFWALAGTQDLQLTDRNGILNILRGRFHIPDYRLLSKDNTLSVSSDIIEALVADVTLPEHTHRFLELYQTMAAARYMASYLTQYKTLPISSALDYENCRMVIAHPKWSLLSTSRVSAAEPSIQNINRDIQDIYTAPKGWTMIFSDSGQIEPRITYSAYIPDQLIIDLITLYDDAYFGLLHYILMNDAEEQMVRSRSIPLKKREISDEMKQKRQRLKVLGLAGNYGSANLGSIDAELGPLYERKIVNHPLRRKWASEVQAAVNTGATHFNGFFGTPVYPESAKRDMGDANYWRGHMVRCGINNPVQTTAAELMFFSIYNACKLLGPNDHIGYYKHDEGLFYIPDDRAEEMAPKLQGCLSYTVEGWIPIGSDLHIGRKESKYVTNLF